MFLTTPRLILREFVEGDWEAVLAYQSDPLYLRYYAWENRDEAGVREFVGWILNSQTETPRTKFQLAMILKAKATLIGNCGIRVNDPRLREGNIGFELGSKYWGRGFATEAAREIVRFGFHELGLHRIWSCCVSENKASARVLHKIGMREEGCLKEKECYRGRWWDQRVFAIIDRDWKQSCKQGETA